MTCVGLILAYWCFAEPASAPQSPALAFCDGYRPTRMSHADTRETKEQVAANNAVWRSACGSRK
jgi:hypothetical protein